MQRFRRDRVATTPPARQVSGIAAERQLTQPRNALRRFTLVRHHGAPMASFRPALTGASRRPRYPRPSSGRPVNSGPRPCLFDVGFPLSGLQDRTHTSDLYIRARHTLLALRARRPTGAHQLSAGPADLQNSVRTDRHYSVPTRNAYETFQPAGKSPEPPQRHWGLYEVDHARFARRGSGDRLPNAPVKARGLLRRTGASCARSAGPCDRAVVRARQSSAFSAASGSLVPATTAPALRRASAVTSGCCLPVEQSRHA
jgi:hypothetical protein